MSLKAQIEAIIYVAEEPVTLEQITGALSTQDSALGTQAIESAIAGDRSFRPLSRAKGSILSLYPGFRFATPWALLFRQLRWLVEWFNPSTCVVRL